ncbi:MAG: thioredoxin [Oscillospiraceae bacterium]|nr:thioredoxin [Oscillospiraceae bacterium]
MSVVHITKDNFQSLVVESKIPVLLDFWAVWCGPCKMIAPMVEAIAEEREDVLVGKINVDEEMELAMQFGITSIPTLVVMKDGKIAATAVGYRPKADIEKLLDA